MTDDDVPGVAPPTYHAPGSPQYGDATSPHNATATQRPAAVAVPRAADDVATVVADARDHGWRILPQATGHGATGDVGSDTLLVDTSALDHVDIDPSRRIARVGAGATWASVNTAAAAQGLVGLSGSAPDVG